jgi:hypothetical protein
MKSLTKRIRAIERTTPCHTGPEIILRRLEGLKSVEELSDPELDILINWLEEITKNGARIPKSLNQTLRRCLQKLQ